MLAFPHMARAARLSFSTFRYACTYLEPVERSENRGYSWLEPNAEITDLQSVPCIDGSRTDLTRYPARRGFEDIAIVCADPDLDFAWSAVTFPEREFVWFALRNPRHLASTVLWFSNGGRHFYPWNGRHVNVLGVEDVTACFHKGLAASCRASVLTEHGVRTVLSPDAAGRLSIPYIQGVARVPVGFERVAAIELDPLADQIVLRSDAGAEVNVACQHRFLSTGELREFGSDTSVSRPIRS